MGYFKPTRSNASGEMQPSLSDDPQLMNRGPPKPLEEVTCYKCGGKGHYANKCPKGHLAFLSHSQSNQVSNSNSFRR